MASTGKKSSGKKTLIGQKSISSFFTPRPITDIAKRLSTELQPSSEKRQKCTSGKEFQNKENTVGNAEVLAQATEKPEPIPEDFPLLVTDQPGSATVSLVEAPYSCAATTGAPAANRPATSQDLVGRRIKVFWPQEREWFKGRIAAFDGKSNHHVEYIDGDKEWLHLADQKWELLGDADEEEPPRKRKRSLVRKAAAPILSSPGSVDSMDDSEVSNFVVGDDSESDDNELDEDLAEEEESPDITKKSHTANKRGSAGKSAVMPPSASARSKGHGIGLPSALPSAHLKPTPGAKAKEGSLKSTLSAATPADKSAAGDEVPKPNALAATDWERYSARALEKFPFLHPDKIKDDKGRRPGHADYNPRMLWIPTNWFKDAKISEGQRQWWDFKSRNYDSVLLFKMGKFYEMFEMDAHTGAEVLGLVHMKGDQPHCGFPESNYHLHAERLARAGLRVVVVEQTETPDQLKIRNEERRAAGKPKAGVVNREMVAVLTQGTLTDPEMLRSHADASYVLSIAEQPAKELSGQPSIGVCAVDCATGQILVGNWVDDDMRTNLRAQLAALRPCEVVIPTAGISSLTRKVLMTSLRKPRVNSLPIPWSAGRTVREIEDTNYFRGRRDENCWPPVLQELIDSGEDNEVGLIAFGGAVSFLRSVLLDRAVVGLARMERLVQITSTMGATQVEAGDGGPEYLSLDGAALDNLEVLETSTGETKGTLLSTVNVCATPAGRRKLKDWLCQPLGSGRVKDILARQDAIQELMEVAAEAAMEARKVFAGVGDLERSIARICASSLGGFGRDNTAVVLYEDQAKKKVAAFLAVLRGLEKVQEVMQGFQKLGSSLKSQILLDLTTLGRRLPDFSIQLKHLLEAADWKMAEELGRITPNKGIDAAFDEAEQGVSEVDGELEDYLDQVRSRMKCKRGIIYVSLNKDSHVLELPEEIAKGVPRDFELVSQRKGFKRFMTTELRKIVKHRAEALDRMETAMAGMLQGMVNTFAENQQVWNGTVAAMSELDALMSLAAFAEHSSAWGPICRPLFVEPDAYGSQVWKAEELRHPVAFAMEGNFVPNNIDLGMPNFTVITGPNMGGKSTLIRQVCLATQLAHVGSCVPAKSLELTPADAIFVRMGARDSIVSGQSSFLVELTETAAALNRATSRSIVALDELGRGTSTSDGAAIASAVLDYLSHGTKCRGLFATHYHRLSEEYANDPNIALRHMACHVTPSAEPNGNEQVTFLYKLVNGSCPKSYGTNVARLAGLPEVVVKRAAEFAAMLEAREVDGTTVPSSALVQEELTDSEKSLLRELGTLLGAPGSAEDMNLALLQFQESLSA